MDFDEVKLDHKKEEIIRDKVKNILYKRLLNQNYGNSFYDLTPVEIANKLRKKINGGKKASKKNPWIKFLKKYREEHPELIGKEVMKKASIEYNQNRQMHF